MCQPQLRLAWAPDGVRRLAASRVQARAGLAGAVGRLGGECLPAAGATLASERQLQRSPLDSADRTCCHSKVPSGAVCRPECALCHSVLDAAHRWRQERVQQWLHTWTPKFGWILSKTAISSWEPCVKLREQIGALVKQLTGQEN